MIPQIIMLSIWMISLGVNISKHGEERNSKYNAYHFIIAKMIIFAILYYGGFWNVLINH